MFTRTGAPSARGLANGVETLDRPTYRSGAAWRTGGGVRGASASTPHLLPTALAGLARTKPL